MVQQPSGNVVITLEPQISGQAIVLDSQMYRTENQDSFFLDAFRFYISGVVLYQNDRIIFREENSVHLIDAAAPESEIFVLKNVPADRYDAIGFYIGTDSLTNVSGALGGDLDPTLGMYWAWNSGYINIKIEGQSNACKTLHHAFTFHIGGYKTPHQTLRPVRLALKNTRIRDKLQAEIHINADLAKFFNRIRLAEINQVMIPSNTAARLADYFKDIFSVP